MSNVPFAAQMEELAAYMASKISVPTIGIGGGYAPIGTIISYMGTTAPQDYLACDGSTKNIADYPQLAEFFAAQFGSANFFGGNGTTTFAVPNLQGEFLRGAGTNSHTNQGDGAAVGTHQDATEIPIATSFDQYTTLRIPYESNIKNYDEMISGVSCKTANAAGGDSYGESISVRPTNTSILYCIKAVVAGEVYSTEEREVGTWIDGKPLYQKTISCGSGPNKTTKEIAHGISNFGTLVHQEYRITLGDGNQITMSNFHGSDKIFSDSSATAGYMNYAIQASISATNIRIMARDADYSSMTNIYATIQYTKVSS